MRLKVKINGRLKDEKSPGSRLPEVEVVDAETGERLRIRASMPESASP
jgi:hypothetical protein